MSDDDVFFRQFTRQADAFRAVDEENSRRQRQCEAQQRQQPEQPACGGHPHFPGKFLRPQAYLQQFANCLASSGWQAMPPTAAAPPHNGPHHGAPDLHTDCNRRLPVCSTYVAAPITADGGTGTLASNVLPADMRVRSWVQERPGRDKNGGADFVLRLYTAASMKRMLQHGAKLMDGSRHIYELLREDEPCHMYFDLECDRSLNPGFDGDAAVQQLLHIVRALVWCAANSSAALSGRYVSAA